MPRENKLIDLVGRRFAYFLLIGTSVAGIIAMLITLFEGHIHANTTQLVPWGLWVALYIYFLGLSAGSFLLSTLIYVFGVKRLEPAGPMALLQALGCLLLGGVLILMDLGHPTRVYKVLSSFNPTSVMSWMGVFYIFYVLIVLAELYLALRPGLVKKAQLSPGIAWVFRWFSLGSTSLDEATLTRDRKWLKILGVIGIPVAIVVHGGVGAIFAVAKARPNWFSGLFPIIFLVSALASGGALLTFLMAVCRRLVPREQRLSLVRDLARLTIGILCFDLLLLISEILVTFYGYIPHEVTGWLLTLFGPYWWVFWFVQIGLGALVPIVIVLWRRTENDIRWLGAAGLLVVMGILGTRLNIVIPPQIIPAFPTMPEAYHHLRFAVGYFPSAIEWLVGLGVVSLGIWGFLGALKLLPLEYTAQGITPPRGDHQ